MLFDLRYALRQLRRAPAFALAAALTLALGIGANASLFALVNAALLRPPPAVAAPERLVALYTSDYSGPRYGTSSYPDLEAYAARADLFAGVAGYAPGPATVGGAEARERVLAERVSPNYFGVLGVRPQTGRFFAAAEGAAGAAPVAVISHALWSRRLGGDPGAVGRPLVVNGRPVEVIGVAPAGFAGSVRGVAADVWVTVAASPALGLGGGELTARGDRALFALARLRPGVTPAVAEAGLAAVAAQLRAAYPEAWTDLHGAGRRVTVLPERAARVPAPVRGPVLAFLALLGGVAAVVLLICCANVAGLVLARASARVREVGVRVSLGASRGRIVRQLLTESALLAALGAAAGWVLAGWVPALFARAVPAGVLPVPLALDLSPDWRVGALTAAVSAAAALLFGLAPALQASRPNVVATLKGGQPEAAGRRWRLRDVVIVGQLAMSLLLLAVAGAFLRTLGAAARIDPGFRADRMLLVSLEPPPAREVDRAAAALAVRDRVAALPGVRAVTWADAVPLGLDVSRRGTSVQGYAPRAGEDMEFAFNVVGPGYFRAMEIPLARGRDFADADRSGAPGVAIVNEAFARRFWPGADPLGRRVSFGGPEGPWLEVVGVARDAKYQSLAESPRPYTYTPALQGPWGVVLHVRTAADPLAAASAVERAAAAAAPGWSVASVRTLDAHVATSLFPQRAAAGILGAFGAVALVLAAVGVYGVVAYAVARRTREIGVRVALGARRGDVLRLVLGRALGLTGWGMALALPLAWGAMRLLGTFLLGGGAGGASLTFAVAAALLAAVALAAAYAPARRAARVDPMAALRTE